MDADDPERSRLEATAAPALSALDCLLACTAVGIAMSFYPSRRAERSADMSESMDMLMIFSILFASHFAALRLMKCAVPAAVRASSFACAAWMVGLLPASYLGSGTPGFLSFFLTLTFAWLLVSAVIARAAWISFKKGTGSVGLAMYLLIPALLLYSCSREVVR